MSLQSKSRNEELRTRNQERREYTAPPTRLRWLSSKVKAQSIPCSWKNLKVPSRCAEKAEGELHRPCCFYCCPYFGLNAQPVYRRRAGLSIGTFAYFSGFSHAKARRRKEKGARGCWLLWWLRRGRMLRRNWSRAPNWRCKGKGLRTEYTISNFELSLAVSGGRQFISCKSHFCALLEGLQFLFLQCRRWLCNLQS